MSSTLQSSSDSVPPASSSNSAVKSSHTDDEKTDSPPQYICFYSTAFEVVESMWEEVLKQECGSDFFTLLKQLLATCAHKGSNH